MAALARAIDCACESCLCCVVVGVVVAELSPLACLLGPEDAPVIGKPRVGGAGDPAAVVCMPEGGTIDPSASSSSNSESGVDSRDALGASVAALGSSVVGVSPEGDGAFEVSAVVSGFDAASPASWPSKADSGTFVRESAKKSGPTLTETDSFPSSSCAWSRGDGAGEIGWPNGLSATVEICAPCVGCVLIVCPVLRSHSCMRVSEEKRSLV